MFENTLELLFLKPPFKNFFFLTSYFILFLFLREFLPVTCYKRGGYIYILLKEILAFYYFSKLFDKERVLL